MKRTVITGACGGLGREFSILCAQRKDDLLLTGTDAYRLALLQKELMNHYNASVQVHVCNLANLEETKAFCEQLKQMQVDLLINNAGFGEYGFFDQMSVEQLIEMNQVNMTSLMMLSHAVLPGMKHSGKGIINVASTASFQPGPMMANYYASKSYVLSLSEALAMELKETPAAVCVLCCGPMETAFHRRAHVKHTWMQKLLMISPLKAAKAGLNGLEKGKRRVIPGALNRIVIALSQLLPDGLVMKIMSFTQSKRQG